MWTIFKRKKISNSMSVGDLVCNADGTLQGYFKYGPSRVTNVRRVNSPEGDAISVNWHSNEYWSKYLKKC